MDSKFSTSANTVEHSAENKTAEAAVTTAPQETAQEKQVVNQEAIQNLITRFKENKTAWDAKQEELKASLTAQDFDKQEVVMQEIRDLMSEKMNIIGEASDAGMSRTEFTAAAE